MGGIIVFLFFLSLFWNFVGEFCVTFFIKRKKRKEKAIIGKIRSCGVVHFRGRGWAGCPDVAPGEGGLRVG